MKLPASVWKPAGTALLALVAVLGWLREPKPPEQPFEEERTEELIRQLADQGWAVTRAEAVGDLTGALLAARDSTDALSVLYADAARQASLLGGRVASLTELLAEAEANLAGAAQRDTVYVEGEQRERAFINFDDGVFAGRVAYLFAPVDSFSVELRARIEAALTMTEAPDGTMLFAATSADPRVRLSLGSASWSPPAPVQVCSWRTRGRWTAFGGFLGVLGGMWISR